MFRFITMVMGFAFAELIMARYLYLFLENGEQILPIWAFVPGIVIGVLWSFRGTIGRWIERNTLWMFYGMLINSAFWMFKNTEATFQVATVVTPFMVTLVIFYVRQDMADAKRRHRNDQKRRVPVNMVSD